MALESIPLSNILEIDNTYLERMKVRTSIMDQHPDETYLCNKPCEEAVAEMYEWLFSTFLPKRFPTMFKIVETSQLPPDTKMNGPCLWNIPADEYIPLQPPEPRKALYLIGRHVDDDTLILLPSSTAPDGSPIYHLQAFVCCFPSGFSTPEKFKQPLASIHKPVPGYEAKLQRSMDRFFAKMELGKAVKRSNWSITTNTLLYSQGGNHLYSDGQTQSDGNAKTLDVNAPDMEQSIERQKEDVEIENCRLRCERQTLHRMPKSKALVFMFKTYQYKLEEVKEEGLGGVLAEAISGLGAGNTPDMAFYKRGVVWGDKVKEYLRS